MADDKGKGQPKKIGSGYELRGGIQGSAKITRQTTVKGTKNTFGTRKK